MKFQKSKMVNILGQVSKFSKINVQTNRQIFETVIAVDSVDIIVKTVYTLKQFPAVTFVFINEHLKLLNAL